MPVRIVGDVCYCSAYPFPHRAGGGRCLGPGDYLCSSCGAVATPVAMEFGVGSFEHHGSVGIDRHRQVVSDCCHTYLLENSSKRGFFQLSPEDLE